TFYRDIQISKEFQPKKILTALRSAYGKSPYFDFAYPDLETLFLNHNKNLFDFNFQLLEWSLSWCTNPFSVNLCEGDAVKADLQIEYLPYLQVFADRFPFQPNLSILDIVFNKGRFNISELGNVKKS
ncbi:MAG: WbqC family protein, partial [Bacteroidota bacterium]